MTGDLEKVKEAVKELSKNVNVLERVKNEYREVAKLSEIFPKENPFFFKTFNLRGEELEESPFSQDGAILLYAESYRNFNAISLSRSFYRTFLKPLSDKTPDYPGEFYPVGNVYFDPFFLRGIYKELKKVEGIPRLIPKNSLPSSGREKLKLLIGKLFIISFLEKEDVEEIFKENKIDNVKNYLEEARRYAHEKDGITDYGIISSYLDSAFFILLRKLGYSVEIPWELASGYFGYTLALTWQPNKKANSYLLFLSETLRIAQKDKELPNKFFETFMKTYHSPARPVYQVKSEHYYILTRTKEALKEVKTPHVNGEEILKIKENAYNLIMPLKVYVATTVDPKYSFLLKKLKDLQFDKRNGYSIKMKQLIKYVSDSFGNQIKITPAKNCKQLKKRIL